jgi:hypothetical protein
MDTKYDTNSGTIDERFEVWLKRTNGIAQVI